jgi:RNA polymerase sigma-70 factor (ECF subfamily)
MLSLDGQEKGTTAACIYSLEEGQLKLCIPFTDPSKRPKAFKTQDGDGMMLLVLTRAKPK